MIINHNLSVMRATNVYKQTNIAQQKSTEKLSSGLRINRAADDSSGLAISEKMRAQIRGLEKAERNIEEGISLVKTADAGLADIQNPNLVRLRTLAVQAASDTVTNDDRILIQEEINQILRGIDDIANGTTFNTLSLLNGATEGVTSMPGVGEKFNYENVLATPPVDKKGNFTFRTNEGYPTTNADNNQNLVFGGGSTSFPSVKIGDEVYPLRERYADGPDVTITETEYRDGSYATEYLIESEQVKVTQFVQIVKDKYEITYEVKNLGDEALDIGFLYHLDTMLGNDDRAPFIVNGEEVTHSTSYAGDEIPDDFIVYNSSGGMSFNPEFQAAGILKGEGILKEPSRFVIENYQDGKTDYWEHESDGNRIRDSVYSVRWDPESIPPNESFKVNTFFGQSVPPTIQDPDTWEKVEPQDILLQVGPNTGMHMEIQLTDARTQALGIDRLDVTTRDMADWAIHLIDGAAQYVTEERTKYGAYQNRLEHTLTNVGSYKENIASSQSRLNDLDYAEETMMLTKTQTLLQANQAMIAQSQQTSQGILELLQ